METTRLPSDVSRRRRCWLLACLVILVFAIPAATRALGPSAGNGDENHILLHAVVFLATAVAVFRRWDIGLLGMAIAGGLGELIDKVDANHIVSPAVFAFVGFGVGLLVEADRRELITDEIRCLANGR